MKFKVGDKVRFKSGDYVPTCSNLNNADYCNMLGYDIQKTYEVRTCVGIGFTCEGIGWNKSDRFELAEPQVGDVWVNADKSEVVKIVGEFKNFAFGRCFTVVYLKGKKKGRGKMVCVEALCRGLHEL